MGLNAGLGDRRTWQNRRWCWCGDGNVSGGRTGSGGAAVVGRETQGRETVVPNPVLRPAAFPFYVTLTAGAA